MGRKGVQHAGVLGIRIVGRESNGQLHPLHKCRGEKKALEAIVEAQGIGVVLNLLWTVDPDSAERLHPSDQRRIIRAAEVYLETGKTITQHNRETQAIPPKYQPLWLGLDFTDRAELYARIDKRVDLMMEQGLIEEIQGLLAAGTPPTATSLQAIGYKEPMAALRGEITMAEAVDKIKQESRRYAKRQLTWFRRNKDIHWICNKEPVLFEAVWEQVEVIIDNCGVACGDD